MSHGQPARTPENFPKMKVRGKGRKLKRIQKMRTDRFELAMAKLTHMFGAVGMQVPVTTEALQRFAEANRMPVSRDRGSDWSKP